MNNVARKEERPARRPASEVIKPTALKLANAVNIGHNEAAYFTSDNYEITIRQNMIISIMTRPRRVGDKAETVYTTVMNAISWRT